MIVVKVNVRDGLTQITAEGHERSGGESGMGGKLCAAVTGILNAAVAGLLGYAEKYPQLMRVDLMNGVDDDEV